MAKTHRDSSCKAAGAAQPTSHPAHPWRGEAKAADAAARHLRASPIPPGRRAAGAARRLGGLPIPSGRKAAGAAQPTSHPARPPRGEAKAADAATRRLRA